MSSHIDSALTLGWWLILSNYVSGLPGSSDGSISPQFCDNAISTFTPSHRLSSLYLLSFSPLREDALLSPFTANFICSLDHVLKAVSLAVFFSFTDCYVPFSTPGLFGLVGCVCVCVCNHCTFCYEGNTLHNFPFLSPLNQSSYRQLERVTNTRYLASYSILLSLFPLTRPTANCSHQWDKHYL